MLKKRLIATLIVRHGIAVQSHNFRTYLPVGRPEVAVEFLNQWGIDEIVVLDISASQDRKSKSYEFLERVAKDCFVPLTVGGGIDSIDDISRLLNLGADKAAMNSICLESPGIITEAAKTFGSQCVVVSIDVVGKSPAEYRTYNAAQRKVLDMHPADWARKVEGMGAGEIYLTSIERDGTKQGYDLELIKSVCAAVKIPVIASGGVGSAQHIIEVFKKTSVSGASAANFFHFFEHSVNLTKAALRQNEIDVRLNTNGQYEDALFTEGGRLLKKPEARLENLVFEKILKETI
jgi:imidazole glycerol-phosphate synthase subunit HisF